VKDHCQLANLALQTAPHRVAVGQRQALVVILTLCSLALLASRQVEMKRRESGFKSVEYLVGHPAQKKQLDILDETRVSTR